jgi:hypothetical protein
MVRLRLQPDLTHHMFGRECLLNEIDDLHRSSPPVEKMK